MAVLGTYTFELEITDDTEVMARLLSDALQFAAREVSGHYIAIHRVDDAVSITHHAVSLVLSYCATLSVNVIRRSEESSRDMTRLEAARLYMQRVVESADKVVSDALTQVEQLEAEERLRFQQPEGEA